MLPKRARRGRGPAPAWSVPGRQRHAVVDQRVDRGLDVDIRRNDAGLLQRRAHGDEYDSAEASWVPNLQVPLDADGARKMIRVIEALEDSDGVQDVFANGDIPDDVLAEPEDDE